MDIRRVVALTGPNIWTNHKALEAWVDIGKFEDFPSDKLPGFNDRIMSWLPSMIEHRCGIGVRGGFFQRLATGTYLGHILEHVTIELQTLAGVQVGFGRARETSERGVYKVLIEFIEEDLALAAMQTAHNLIMAAVDDLPFDAEGEVTKLRAIADRVCLGPGTSAIVRAAQTRGIPIVRLNSGSLVQLGYCSAQKRIWTAETDRTSAVAEAIAQDKQLTGELLRTVGVQVPEGRTVATVEEAWNAAQELGVPVVVKPRDGNHGRGVSINLKDADAIRKAFQLATSEGSAVVVERMIPGAQHRVLVVGSKVVAASRAEPDQVAGDGVHTVKELVEITNKDPLRGAGGVYPLSKLALDEIAIDLLRQQGLDTSSILPSGQTVVLNYNGDFVTDVTNEVHADVAEQCVLAAQTVGLNIAGIDLIIERIDQPFGTQSGAIIEVNASPGLVMHVKPVQGQARPVGAAIVSGLFEEGDTGRVPIIAVTGTNGKTSTVNLLEHILTAAGKVLGVTSSDGLSIKGRQIAKGDCADSPSARRILVNPFVNTAIFEIAANSVLNQGLAFDQCQVAVVTNLGSGDHLGAKYVENLEVMTKVKRAPVDVVLPDGTAVLNGNDPTVAGLSKYCRGDTIYFSRSLDDPDIGDLIRSGKRVISIDHFSVVLAEGDKRVPIMAASAIPNSYGGHWGFQLENAMAAIGAAWALGIHANHIVEGLGRAASTSPNHFCCLERNGATIVLSLCRNLSALNATIDAIGSSFNPNQSIAFYGIHADHRLSDSFDQGLRLGQAFDKVIVSDFLDAACDDKQQLLAELERGILTGGGTCEASRSYKDIQDIAYLSRLVNDLTAHQLLLVQLRDSSEMTAVRLHLSDLGAQMLTNGPTDPNLSSANSRESNQLRVSSNNV